jgi:beta-1,4-mannosyl-glycoprotein beta-1,4-N-acetylglucosaminyltransferase
MVIDSFLAFNELELARFRIEYLWDLTDRIIIGESRLTFAGLEKPLFFAEWLESHPEFQEKVSTLEIKLEKPQGNWEREYASRDAMMQYLRDKFRDQRAIFSDIDEIPTRQQLSDFMKVNENVHFATQTYYRRANFALRDSNHRFWNYGVMICDHSILLKNGGRFNDMPLLKSNDFGGHFSYLGMGRELVSIKMKSFSHSELETSYLDAPKFLEFCDKYGVDHLGRFQEKGMGIFQIIKKECFSDLQNEMYDYQKAWFIFPKKHVPIVFRALASAAVTHASRNRVGSKSSLKAITQSNGNGFWIYKAKFGIFLQIGSKIMRMFRNKVSVRICLQRGVKNGFSSQKAPQAHG